MHAPAQSGALARNWHPSGLRRAKIEEDAFLIAVEPADGARSVEAGLDPHLHATGDRAVRDSLDGIEYEKFVYQPNMKKAAMATHDHDA